MMKPFPDPLSCDQGQLAGHLDDIQKALPGILCKGIPADFSGCFGDIGNQGYFLGDKRLPMPVAFLRDDVMLKNRQWMSEFLAKAGVSLAPHGKTTLSPELFNMQLEDGIWGITAATAQQVVFLARLGLRRILLANQLVGEGNIRMVLDILQQYPSLQLWLTVDSRQNVDQLVNACSGYITPPSLRLLVEIGVEGGRTGVRCIADALDLGRHIMQQPYVQLGGIEGYEGIVAGHNQAAREQAVQRMIATMIECAEKFEAEKLWACEEILLTAGGTEFFDLCSPLKQFQSQLPRRVLIRSGCYISSDSIAYKRAFQRIEQRSSTARQLSVPAPQGALEVWAVFQSNPESGLGFVTLGKRDISHDWELPVPLYWFRPGEMSHPQRMPEGHTVTKLNDQHAYLNLPEGTPLQVGDLIGFGISHACTTFDKWHCLLRVDDQYRVTGAVRTFF
jgi:D-serine dehydratase